MNLKGRLKIMQFLVCLRETEYFFNFAKQLLANKHDAFHS